jgi:hypothetical protein
MRSPWDRLTAVSTYGPSGSEEDDEPDFCWDFSGLGNPSATRDFMTACDYCLSDCSDGSHSFGDEDCGPSHECFHVDLGGPDEGNHLGIPENGDPSKPAPRVDILRELAVVQSLRGVRTHSSSKSARCRPGSTREQEHLSRSAGTSGRNGKAKLRPEKRVIYPRASSTASPTMSGQGRHRLPVGSARTWLQQRYFSARCRSHQPPKGGVSRESSRISWRMPRSGRPKALPPEGRGTPRSIAPRLPDSCGKPQSTPGARATQRLRPRVASAPPPQPSSPPRREGAPRLPTQVWGTLRQRGGSESLARTTRSAGFQPGHTTGAVPDPVPNPDYHHKVLGGDKAGTVARGLPTSLSAEWNGR